MFSVFAIAVVIAAVAAVVVIILDVADNIVGGGVVVVGWLLWLLCLMTCCYYVWFILVGTELHIENRLRAFGGLVCLKGFLFAHGLFVITKKSLVESKLQGSWEP